MGYHEQFESGAGGDGAYVCQLTITAPAFELRAGGADAAEGAIAEAAIPEGIMADSRGVYGYMPKPDSEFAKFDFSNPKIVREGRKEFLT